MSTIKCNIIDYSAGSRYNTILHKVSLSIIINFRSIYVMYK